MNRETRLGLHNLPRVNRIAPNVDEIRRRVYNLKHDGIVKPVEATIHYVSHGGQTTEITGLFGMYATFAYRKDLAFTIKGKDAHTGILLVEGQEIRISTPFTGRSEL